MQIKDITINDIRTGKNWRVPDPDSMLDEDFPLEDLEIEPLSSYEPSDTLVYTGIYVYLKDLGEPRSGLFMRLTGRGRRRKNCRCAPDDPKDLETGMTPVVEPLLMIKEVQHSGRDYCQYVDGTWRQCGLEPNPDAPLGTEFFADLVPEDPEFDALGDKDSLRKEHKKAFENWIKYLQE